MTVEFRNLPSVDKVLGEERIRSLITTYSREAVVELVRARLEEVRRLIALGKPGSTMDALVESICQRAQALWEPTLGPVINATGVIIHTNLGRAPLSEEALALMAEVARGYSTLEYDRATGQRGSRHTHVEHLLRQLTGAEAALVVNNNASAVLLGLTALAQGKEVVVSRGEAVEIGGGFRVPDVLRQSGAALVEVGTTNRTYAADYRQAISARTGTLLKVHTSNFRVVGFTHAPSNQELVEVGHAHSLPVLHDLGSGCLLDTAKYGLASEPMPQQSIQDGIDLVFFSGDKLLGGPQAGIAAGKKALVDQLKAHPLARAVRIDKLSLAALVATLLHYIKQEAETKVPVWRMIAASAGELEWRAKAWATALGEGFSVTPGESTIGGGSLPGETLPTWLLALSDETHRWGGVETLAQRLRQHVPPVIGRIEEGRLLLDPRTVLPSQDEEVLRALRQALEV